VHVGGARTASQCCLRQTLRGQFLLRIEDTDKSPQNSERHARHLRGPRVARLWDEDVSIKAPTWSGIRPTRRLCSSAEPRTAALPAGRVEERRKEAEARKEAFRYDGAATGLSKEELWRAWRAGSLTIRFRVPEGVTSGPISYRQSASEQGHRRLRHPSLPTPRRSTTSPSCPTISRCASRCVRGDDHISIPLTNHALRALGADLPTFAHRR